MSATDWISSVTPAGSKVTASNPLTRSFASFSVPLLFALSTIHASLIFFSVSFSLIWFSIRASTSSASMSFSIRGHTALMRAVLSRPLRVPPLVVDLTISVQLVSTQLSTTGIRAFSMLVAVVFVSVMSYLSSASVTSV